MTVVWTACGDTPGAADLVRLRPILRADTSSSELLLPQALAILDDEHLAVVEAGRRTLTVFDTSGAVVERRYLWNGAAGLAQGGDELGRTIVPTEGGVWVLVSGIGPMLISSGSSPLILGAGGEGAVPQAGVPVDAADLTSVTAIGADETGTLLVAAAGEIYRVGESLGLVEATFREDGNDAPLVLFQVGALATDTEGNIYVCDSGTGWIWVIGSDGRAVQLSGRGDRLSIPTSPVPAREAAIDLVFPVLQWDPSENEILLLANGSLFAIDADASGGFEAATIRSISSAPALAAGVVSRPAGLVVSSLTGAIVTIENGEQTQLFGRSSGELDLGRADAIEALGASSLAFRDSAQHRWSIYIPGVGAFPWLDSGSPRTSPIRLLVADEHANVYYQTTSELRHVEVNVGFRTLGRRVPSPVFDGQSITQFQLPDLGELRADVGTVLMLDASLKILLRFDTDTGTLEHVGGGISGGGKPSATFQPRNQGLTLSAPRALEMCGSLLLLIDLIGDQSAVLAMNATEEEARVAGSLVQPGRTAVLGGAGDETYEVGADFIDIDLDDIRRAVCIDERLYLAVHDDAAPSLVVVDSDGLVTEAVWSPDTPPDAMALIAADALLLGWDDEPELVVLNLGAAPIEVFATEIPAAAAAHVAEVSGGVRDLAVSGDGDVFVLQPDGALSAVAATTTPLGQAPSSSLSVTLTADGGLLTVSEGAIWGLDTGEDALLLGQPFPAAPGDEVVSGVSEWVNGWPISTLPFADNLSALAIAPNGDLLFVDWEVQALFRSEALEEGVVTPSSPTVIESEGDPLPNRPGPLALAVDTDQNVYLATEEAVYSFQEQSWTVLAGTGAEGIPTAANKTQAEVRGISGISPFGDRLLVRSHEGLFALHEDGRVEDVYPALGAPTLDPTLLLNMQSLAIVDGHPVVIIAGEIHQVVGWPQ